MTTTQALPTDLRVAVRDLAPEDRLDKRHRHGEELKPDEMAELKARRLAVVRAGVSICKLYAGARLEVIKVVQEFLKKPKNETAKAVQSYLDSSDLVEMVRSKLSEEQLAGLKARTAAGKPPRPDEWQGELVRKASLGSKPRQAEYHLLNACFTRYASDASASLRTIAYAGASHYEKAQRPPKPGGWGHPFIVGLVNAERR